MYRYNGRENEAQEEEAARAQKRHDHRGMIFPGILGVDYFYAVRPRSWTRNGRSHYTIVRLFYMSSRKQQHFENHEGVSC